MYVHVVPDLYACHTQLLNKDPKQRIGCGPGGMEEIKQHPWFASLDWAKVANKELPAPFLPDVCVRRGSAAAGGAMCWASAYVSYFPPYLRVPLCMCVLIRLCVCVCACVSVCEVCVFFGAA